MGYGPSIRLKEVTVSATSIEPPDWRACGDEVGQDTIPSGSVGVSPARSAAAEPLPASVLDLHPRAIGALIVEPDLHFGGIRPVGPDVPQIGQATGRIPYGDLSPLDLAPGGGPLEDPATGSSFEDDLDTGLGGHRVVHRPP